MRHESLKVLHLVLSNVSNEKVEPFFDIMSTYLRSAMTHIDNRIQEDSLLFLDLLLVCTPEKVVQDFHKILPNFLDMISKLRVDSKPGRTLTVNLGSQITSVKWRVKVLHRLKDYLMKYIEHNHVHEKDKPIAANTHMFDETKMNHYTLFNPIYTSVCHVSCFSAKNSQDIVLLDEVEKFKQYINTLIPLLYETWLEVCPKTSSEINIETVINEDAASLLKHSLEVITLLFDLVQYLQKKNPSSNIENVFSQKYRLSFSKHFVSSFPYATNVRKKQKSADSPFEDIITDPKLVEENLKICHLFVKLNPNVNVKDQTKEITSVLNYVEKTFKHNAHDFTGNIIISVLDTIFSKQNNWTKTLSVMESVFQKIIREYFNENINKSFKQQIFSFLCKIALNNWLSHFHSSEAFEMWVKNLPKILLEESITSQTVNILHLFAVRNNNIFNSVTKPNLLKIIQNLPKIVVSDNNANGENSYYKLFSLLYWIKTWDTDSLNMLEKQLINNEYKMDHGKYIFDTLRLRVGGIL